MGLSEREKVVRSQTGRGVEDNPFSKEQLILD